MQSLNRFMNYGEAYPILRKYEKTLLAMFKVQRLMLNAQWSMFNSERFFSAIAECFSFEVL